MHTVALRGLGVINSNNEKEDRKPGRGQAKGARESGGRWWWVGTIETHYINVLNFQRISNII